jgi:hypothetical protein
LEGPSRQDGSLTKLIKPIWSSVLQVVKASKATKTALMYYFKWDFDNLPRPPANESTVCGQHIFASTDGKQYTLRDDSDSDVWVYQAIDHDELFSA